MLHFVLSLYFSRNPQFDDMTASGHSGKLRTWRWLVCPGKFCRGHSVNRLDVAEVVRLRTTDPNSHEFGYANRRRAIRPDTLQD
jgi:hypothetical protein